MSESGLAPVSALAGHVRPRHHGRETAGVQIALQHGLSLASLAARRGREAALRDAVRAAFGAELPEVPRRVQGREVAFIWAGPHSWLAASAGGDLEAELRAGIGAEASVTDQSDARAVFRASGPDVRAALAKGLPIDLHPRAFRPGDTALSAAAHTNVHVWQLDAAPTYELAVFRGYARSFLDWLLAASAEFGADLADPC